jgi:hypothetical protein
MQNRSSKSLRTVAKMAFNCQSILSTFVDAVLAAGRTTIGTALNEFMKLDGVAQNPDVRTVAEKRVEILKKATSTKRPIFSWCQKNAKFPGSQATAVNAFFSR